MNSTKIVLLVGLTLFYACHAKDPEADLLIGSWNQVQYKVSADSAWKDNAASWVSNVIFRADGTVGTATRMPFNGGWCNDAVQYTLSTKTINFVYGQPNCIPFVNPGTLPDTKIIDLTSQSLILTQGTYWLKFERQ